MDGETGFEGLRIQFRPGEVRFHYCDEGMELDWTWPAELAAAIGRSLVAAAEKAGPAIEGEGGEPWAR